MTRHQNRSITMAQEKRRGGNKGKDDCGRGSGRGNRGKDKCPRGGDGGGGAPGPGSSAPTAGATSITQTDSTSGDFSDDYEETSDPGLTSDYEETSDDAEQPIGTPRIRPDRPSPDPTVIVSEGPDLTDLDPRKWFD